MKFVLKAAPQKGTRMPKKRRIMKYNGCAWKTGYCGIFFTSLEGGESGSEIPDYLAIS